LNAIKEAENHVFSKIILEVHNSLSSKCEKKTKISYAKSLWLWLNIATEYCTESKVMWVDLTKVSTRSGDHAQWRSKVRQKAHTHVDMVFTSEKKILHIFNWEISPQYMGRAALRTYKKEQLFESSVSS